MEVTFKSRRGDTFYKIMQHSFLGPLVGRLASIMVMEMLECACRVAIGERGSSKCVCGKMVWK